MRRALSFLPVVVFAALAAATALSPALGEETSSQPSTDPSVSAPDTPTPSAIDPMVLHPGDIVSWDPAGHHVVQFGGATDVAPTTLIAKLLDLEFNLETDFGCVIDDTSACDTSDHKKFKATVREDLDLAALGADAAFNFTCGIHPSIMVTKSFTITAAEPGTASREVHITNDGFVWMIVDTAGNIPIMP